MKADSDQFWYSKNTKSTFLLPLSWLFRSVSSLRRAYYSVKTSDLILEDVFIIIVGNLTVGGAGKTPFVEYLAKRLLGENKQVGIISRGYKRETTGLIEVEKDSPVNEVGDEVLQLKQKLGCPVVVSIDRHEAAEYIHKKFNLDVIISDDGLQHYNLPRNYEMVIVDGEREFGNGRCLPAGPLREPIKRLNTVDLIVCNGENPAYEYQYFTTCDKAISLSTKDDKALSSFAGTKIHAVAGIGNPNRFFSSLKKYNLQLIEHVFPDHHKYEKSDFDFNDDLPILMTEKDAVKCSNFANHSMWYVPITLTMNTMLENKLAELTEEL